MADMTDPHIQAAADDLRRLHDYEDHGGTVDEPSWWEVDWIQGADGDVPVADVGQPRFNAIAKVAVRAWLASVGMSSENLAHADEACALYFAGTWRDRMVRPWADAVRAVEQA
jgi:hypothetical protein